MAKKRTPWQRAINAYMSAASKTGWTNEEFYENVQRDFNVSEESARSLLMMALLGRREDEWKPEGRAS